MHQLIIKFSCIKVVSLEPCSKCIFFKLTLKGQSYLEKTIKTFFITGFSEVRVGGTPNYNAYFEAL